MKTRIAWNRRVSPKAEPTTDKHGYRLMVFSFTDGTSEEVMVRREDDFQSSCWQEVAFTSPAYMTTVELWVTQDGLDQFIYALPSTQMQEALSEAMSMRRHVQELLKHINHKCEVDPEDFHDCEWGVAVEGLRGLVE